ncbi:MAG: hypothetical protein NC182_01395 [Prevotella sp.]|nr:hypothetical protein [Staphylococcus sp.]MCM1349837.1 hypothetical protein [Prevotella sp.]
MMEIPIFIVAGFLDSGKTTFIIDAIEKDGFEKKGRTLVILCEEGELELSDEFAHLHNTTIERLQQQDQFTAEYLQELAIQYCPDRVIVELNCMWNINELYFPEEYRMAQVITFIDFSTFSIYYNNMRQKFIDLIKLSDLVVFNRCDEPSALAGYQTNLKLVNGNAQYMVMDENGVAQKAFEEPLPYDIDADIIEIGDDDFGRWYIDTYDNPERYRGKKVAFNCMVVQSKKLPKNTFVAGRHAMTCCADDVQLYGHLCKILPGVKLKNKAWVRVVARLEFEYSEEYQEEEGVLYPESIENIPPLAHPILDLR